MQLTQLFLRKLKLEMRLLHVVEKRPTRIIKLDALDPEEFNISEQAVTQWSENNIQLYQLILQNGMAQFICNKDYLFQFYRHLSFNQKSVEAIDQASLRFKNLRVLSLVRNNIKYIDNLPSNCRELYVDFNQIEDVHQKGSHSLELLSISHNIITDTVFFKIAKVFSQLRCVNLSWNRIQKIKDFVELLEGLSKLKVLVAYGNPISMLALYYSYITQHKNLLYIDGQKYVKPEEIKKVEEPKVEEKKELKQEKKETKKQTKKAGKVEQKPVQPPPKVQLPKVEVKRELTKDDFQRVKLTIKVTNLQQFSGNSFDASLFPAQVDIKSIQTNYWIKYRFLDSQVQHKQKMISFDNTTIDNDQTRLNLDTTIVKDLVVGYDSFLKFNNGLRIQVHQIEPKMVKDAETLELKPEINNGQIPMNTSILGAIYVDLRHLHTAQTKETKFKYRLFSAQAVRNPLFADPYEDEAELINRGKQQFEKELKKREEQAIKKLEQEELLKQQKKGGKDQKKAAVDKKAVKKEGKDAPVVQKRKSQKCDYPLHNRQYCVLEGSKMYKGKSLLCVSILIE